MMSKFLFAVLILAVTSQLLLAEKEEDKPKKEDKPKEEENPKVEEKEEGLARGWGDSIAWQTLKDGKAVAAKEKKPLMLLIHKSWCGACQALRPVFGASKEIAELSKKFVMVNALDDEEPEDTEYAPDGGYIPRILFLSPEGEVQKQYINDDGSDEYKYFHASPDSIVDTMNKVLGQGVSHIKEDL